MKPSRNTLLRINNILLYLGFSFLLGTGLLLVLRLPPGSQLLSFAPVMQDPTGMHPQAPG